MKKDEKGAKTRGREPTAEERLLAGMLKQNAKSGGQG